MSIEKQIKEEKIKGKTERRKSKKSVDSIQLYQSEESDLEDSMSEWSSQNNSLDEEGFEDVMREQVKFKDEKVVLKKKEKPSKQLN